MQLAGRRADDGTDNDDHTTTIILLYDYCRTTLNKALWFRFFFPFFDPTYIFCMYNVYNTTRIFILVQYVVSLFYRRSNADNAIIFNRIPPLLYSTSLAKSPRTIRKEKHSTGGVVIIQYNIIRV